MSKVNEVLHFLQVKDAHYKALAHFYAAVVHEMLADTFSK